jgi:hypothetical protein
MIPFLISTFVPVLFEYVLTGEIIGDGRPYGFTASRDNNTNCCTLNMTKRMEEVLEGNFFGF